MGKKMRILEIDEQDVTIQIIGKDTKLNTTVAREIFDRLHRLGYETSLEDSIFHEFSGNPEAIARIVIVTYRKVRI